MPFIYGFHSKTIGENYTTSGVTNTEIDFMFIKPGATRFVGLLSFRPQGKAGGLTALSGIGFRIKQWTTTASSAGTSLASAAVNNIGPAIAATQAAGAGAGTNAVTSGTGGPTLVGGCGCSASGPGGWVAPNPDAPIGLDGGANKSIDVFSSAVTVSLNYEFAGEIQE